MRVVLGQAVLGLVGALIFDASYLWAVADSLNDRPRRLGQAAAWQELADSGLWTGEAATAYANALGAAMTGPALSRLRALAPH